MRKFIFSAFAIGLLPALAPAVRVPVQFSIAEYEKVWQTDDAAMTEIAAMFSGAPRFTVNRQPEAGHNISLGHSAADYHAKVLSFAEECIGASPSKDEAAEEAAGLKSDSSDWAVKAPRWLGVSSRVATRRRYGRADRRLWRRSPALRRS